MPKKKQKYPIYFKEKKLQKAWERVHESMKKAGITEEWIQEHFS